MKELYESPTLVEYGPIAECTFTYPRWYRHHRDDDDEGASGFPHDH